ncbi:MULTISPECIES: 50S ribosomal protein L13 [Haloarcula]|uniref:Large ribosomal subunit protein uL13 n=1 Tax=Haloarcula pellucida TaxID=1427151 RepID=A0A830GJQ3_9EURY|nr:MULTISPECIES: 50S ribosomal protein L13 [Halomicroarcula]MBX0347818.1 50S ribosomal protein L13 [Halomicroarcula pellucida]MDS0276248.1 50S ribosomal protein L13 [Halomicroarcula sp. S1AR25-4]GGN90440.1 50S ribosomal protein L13 [Halomicroarcula pellucida]
MSLAEFDADVVVDARDCIMGRVASAVAEEALDGQTVAVVNAERAVITGREEQIVEKYKKRIDIGDDNAYFYPKRPDGIFKRAIRGMLPHKKQRGREAFENVRVYVGNPHDEDGDVLEGTSLDRLSNIKFVSLGDVSEALGANKTW